jgi:hypothetical protein
MKKLRLMNSTYDNWADIVAEYLPKMGTHDRYSLINTMLGSWTRIRDQLGGGMEI